MRKRTIICFFDTIFWYLVYMLPLIVWLVLLCRNAFDPNITMQYVFDTMGLGIVNDNVILTSLIGIFGVGGVFPLFANNAILVYGTWFIATMILHLAVDFLLFIPRLCHKWMGELTNVKD